jgi:hypothetical protein
MDVCRKWRAL